ncbi:hypothetical protein BCR35DRAFT_261594 [Leucosporidium creatinivorum]|uniref:Integral membrane protein n=1 Tax=Leucosporidium creatinivorum TaxID=106004 RepID=A0A1Y2G0Q8_9BASI|nr:hypothetical protein BCR35DRAFT_261594 [Leucosporidium creatinivorum]
MSVTVQPKQLNPLLAKYLASLATRPILTKSSTSAVLSFISEIVAGHLAGSPPPPLSAKQRTGIPPLDLLKQNQKALKLAAYGFFISAPMGHTLLNILQKVFAGKTSARAKILMILCSNIFISPIQQSVYISAMAVINGADSLAAVYKAWKMSFWPVMRFTWVVSTLSMAIAQRGLAPELWVPFFTTVGVTAGTYVNVQAKKKALALRAKAQAKAEAEKKDVVAKDD